MGQKSKLSKKEKKSKTQNTKKNQNKTNQKTVRTPIIIALIIGFLICALCALLASASGTEKALNTYFQEEVNGKKEAFLIALTQRGEKISTNLKLLHTDPAFLDVVDAAYFSGDIFSITKYCNDLQKSIGVSNAFILDNSGKILYSSQRVIPDPNMLKKNGIQELVKSRAVAYQLSYYQDRLCYVAISKVETPMGFSGYCVLEDNLIVDEVSDHFGRMLNAEFTSYYENKRIGTTLFNQEQAGTRLTGSRVNYPDVMEAVYERGETYTAEQLIGLDNYLVVYFPSKVDNGTHNVMFSIAISTNVVESTIGAVVKTSAIASALQTIALIVLVLAILTSLMFVPLKKASKAIENLAEESEETDLTYRINFNKNNEIGNLCQDVDKFIDRQQRLIGELKAAQNSLEDIGATLGSSSVESASAISQIMANIESVKKQTKNQITASSSASEKMKEVFDSTATLDKLIENQSAGIVQSSASIEEMVSNIASVSSSVKTMSTQFKELITVTQNGRETQAQVNKKILQMNEQSKLMIEANRVIAKIASQTNLLAMNAAIEAAHAGEAGAGFSVVADEIRTLAENSSKQSHNIASELKLITKTVEEVVAASNQSNEAFKIITEKISDTDNLVNEIDYAMEEQDSASKQVLEALKDVNASTMDVQATSKSMKDVTSNAGIELDKLNEIIYLVDNSMDEMTAGAQEINKSASEVSNMATETMENIKFMDNLIGKFKI